MVQLSQYTIGDSIKKLAVVAVLSTKVSEHSFVCCCSAKESDVFYYIGYVYVSAGIVLTLLFQQLPALKSSQEEGLEGLSARSP